MRYPIALLSTVLLAAPIAADAQVSAQRILNAASEPQNWLTYGGSYQSQRYSTLNQITPENIRTLEQKWVLQDQVFGAWESNPLVVDGIMYVTERPNDVIALDAKTGKVFWLYRYTNSPDARVCCGSMRISWRSTRATGGRCGTSPSAIRRPATRSPWRRLS